MTKEIDSKVFRNSKGKLCVIPQIHDHTLKPEKKAKDPKIECKECHGYVGVILISSDPADKGLCKSCVFGKIYYSRLSDLQLCPDIIKLILGYVDDKTVLKCSLVSKTFRTLISQEQRNEIKHRLIMAGCNKFQKIILHLNEEKIKFRISVGTANLLDYICLKRCIWSHFSQKYNYHIGSLMRKIRILLHIRGCEIPEPPNLYEWGFGEFGPNAKFYESKTVKCQLESMQKKFQHLRKIRINELFVDLNA